jgi:VanZ family protein
MIRIARFIAWIALAAILLLTLVRPTWRPLSAAPHLVEHLLAFFIVGGAFALAYPRDVRIAVAALPLIGALELAQLVVPGRHARLGDFLVNVIGAYAGIALVALARRVAWTERAPR